MTWQEAALLAAQWPDALTPWERGFLLSVIRFPRPSAKQLAILDRLVCKARGLAGVREPADPTAWHPPAPPDPPTDPPEAEPGETPRPDPRTLFGKFTLSKRSRLRIATNKRPRDRLLASLGTQREIVCLLQQGRDPKREGYTGRTMFFEDHGRYVVQITSHNQPLDLLPDANTIQVNSLEEVEEVLAHTLTLAHAGHFDDQIDRLAAVWSETRRDQRTPAEKAA